MPNWTGAQAGGEYWHSWHHSERSKIRSWQTCQTFYDRIRFLNLWFSPTPLCKCWLTLLNRSWHFIPCSSQFMYFNPYETYGRMTVCLCITVYPSRSGCSQCPGEWWLCSEDCWFWSSKRYPLSWLLPQNHRRPTAREMDGAWGSVSPCVHNAVRCVST